MNLKSKTLIILIILITNILGYTLRYFGLETYFVLLGFRFHLSSLLPLLILIKKENRQKVKIHFKKFELGKISKTLIWILLAAAVIIIVLFITTNAEFVEPEYFYEFGLSSIVDYPIYLIWNLPQIIFLYIFLSFIKQNFERKFAAITLVLFTLFLFELIPAPKHNLIPFNLITYLIIVISLSISFLRFDNIYRFGIYLFSIFWIAVLIFGSSSKELIHLFFATQYSGWDGFIEINKNIIQFVFPFFYLMNLLILIWMTDHPKKNNAVK